MTSSFLLETILNFLSVKTWIRTPNRSEKTGELKLTKMARGLLFRGQKNGGYCNIHKGINFNNSARQQPLLFKEATKIRAKKIPTQNSGLPSSVC